MLPVATRAICSKTISKLCSHRDNSISHELNIIQPLCSQFRVCHNLSCNSGSMSGRITVHRSDKNLNLRLNSGSFFSVSTNHSEGSHSLSIKSHVLGKTLSEKNIVAFINKIAKSKGITVHITRCKTLICHVKVWEKVLLFNKS